MSNYYFQGEMMNITKLFLLLGILFVSAYGDQPVGIPQKSYYEILEVAKTSSFDEIREAYKKLAREYHPDKIDQKYRVALTNGEITQAQFNQIKNEAEAHMKMINVANEVLSDQQKRADYDRSVSSSSLADLIRILKDKAKTEQQKLTQIRNALLDGANVNTASQDIPHITPLMLASELGYFDIAQLLLSNNAKIDEVDDFGSTALFYAARSGRVDVATLLVMYGADTKKINKNGNNVLLHALRSYGANLEAAKDKEQFKRNLLTTIMFLIEYGAAVNATSRADDGKTPLIWAVLWNDFELADALLDSKADVCIQDAHKKAVYYYLPDTSKSNKLSAKDIGIINRIKKIASTKCPGKMKK